MIHNENIQNQTKKLFTKPFKILSLSQLLTNIPSSHQWFILLHIRYSHHLINESGKKL